MTSRPKKAATTTSGKPVQFIDIPANLTHISVRFTAATWNSWRNTASSKEMFWEMEHRYTKPKPKPPRYAPPPANRRGWRKFTVVNFLAWFTGSWALGTTNFEGNVMRLHFKK